MSRNFFLKNGNLDGKIDKETIIINNLREPEYKLLFLLAKGMDEAVIAEELGVSIPEIWEKISNLETCFFSILIEKNLKSIKQYAKLIAVDYTFC